MGELQYLNLVKTILACGVERLDRTKVGTLSIFGTQSRYSLQNFTLPLLTTKKMQIRSIIEELLWFIRGSTSSLELSKKAVTIWDANSTREFLDSRGLSTNSVGDLGPVYGFQWRHWGANYIGKDANYAGQGIDQLQGCIDQIRHNPNDRRIIMSAWNPSDIPRMALPPCHCMVQFFVSNGELSSMLTQRSGDMGLGVPFNIASYAILTHMIAHVTGLLPGEFIHNIGDAHVYLNHIDALKEQVTRIPREFPTMKILRKIESIDEFKIEDFQLSGYNPYPSIKLDMAV